MCKCFQSCNGKKVQNCFSRLTKAVDQLFQHIIVFLLALNACNTLVDIQLLELIANIGIRDKSINIQINGRLKIIHGLDSLGLLNSLTEHLAVKIISHCIHVSVLLCPEKISRTAELQILHCDLKAASKIRIFSHGTETFLRSFLEHLVFRIHQKRIRSSVGTSHTAAQLIKLGKAVSVRIMDDHGIYIGNIQSRLNDRCGNQHIHITIDKIIHYLLQLPLTHLPMSKIHPGFRHKFGYAKSYLSNIIDTVVYIVDLAAAAKLPADSLPDSLLIILHNISLDGHTIHRRFFQNTHVTDTDQAHMKRTRDRSGSQSQHIHIFFHLLDLLFMSHTETLLLINDQKTQILEFHILGKNSVGTDHNVNLAFSDSLDGLFLLGGSTETTEEIYLHRKLLHTLYKGIVMLLGKNSSRYKINNLTALLHSLKSCSQGNLCFSVANIAAHKAVHDLCAFHIPLGVLDRCQLILCLLVREHFLKFSLPYSIRATDVALFFLADSVKLHQLFCNIFDSSFDTALGLVPLLPAQLVQLRCLRIIGRTGVFLQGIQLGCQNIKIAATAIFNLDIVLNNAVNFYFFDTTVNSKPMFLMDNKISNRKLRKILNTVAAVLFLFFALLLLFAKNIRLCHHREFDQRILESTSCMAINNHDLTGIDDTAVILAVKSIQPFL